MTTDMRLLRRRPGVVLPPRSYGTLRMETLGKTCGIARTGHVLKKRPSGSNPATLPACCVASKCQPLDPGTSGQNRASLDPAGCFAIEHDRHGFFRLADCA